MESLSEEKQKTLELVRKKIYEDLSKFLEDIESEKEKFNEKELTDKILNNVTKLWEGRRSNLNLKNTNVRLFRGLIESAVKARSESEMLDIILRINVFMKQRDIFSAIDDSSNLEFLTNNLFPYIYLMNLQGEFKKIGINMETTVNPDWNISLADIDIYFEFVTPFGTFKYDYEKLSKYIDKDKIIPLKVDLIRKTNTQKFRREQKEKVMNQIRDENFEKNLLLELIQ